MEYVLDQDSKLSGYIQYKGTDICIDLCCECGWNDHYDGYFCYGFTCPKCGQSYTLPDELNFTKVEVDSKNDWKFITFKKDDENASKNGV